MNLPPPNLIRVERIALRGPGVVILTGPSSCGKGEVAAALCSLTSVDRARHLSMGEILRSTTAKAKQDPAFAARLEQNHQLSDQGVIGDSIDSSPELLEKVERHLGNTDVSQLGWLEHCTTRGLLIPNRWTQELMAAAIDSSLQEEPENGSPFILDGYPRTVVAAEHLLRILDEHGLPVLKVLHLSISKAEMTIRAGKRGRSDDHAEALKRRFDFYVESVQPSVDYLKKQLGADRIALIDAHQPAFDAAGDLDLQRSIDNVVVSALRALGAPRIVVRDLIERSPGRMS